MTPFDVLKDWSKRPQKRQLLNSPPYVLCEVPQRDSPNICCSWERVSTKQGIICKEGHPTSSHQTRRWYSSRAAKELCGYLSVQADVAVHLQFKCLQSPGIGSCGDSIPKSSVVMTNELVESNQPRGSWALHVICGWIEPPGNDFDSPEIRTCGFGALRFSGTDDLLAAAEVQIRLRLLLPPSVSWAITKDLAKYVSIDRRELTGRKE